MNYWLVKSEPTSYAWDDLTSKGEDIWDGVRNYQARNFMIAMKLGDLVFFYHSGKDKKIVGLAEVSEEGFADPGDSDFIAIKIKSKQALNNSIGLSEIKANDQLSELLLIKQFRLSVMPINKIEAAILMKMSL